VYVVGNEDKLSFDPRLCPVIMLVLRFIAIGSDFACVITFFLQLIRVETEAQEASSLDITLPGQAVGRQTTF
jgi:hypothetical protein